MNLNATESKPNYKHETLGRSKRWSGLLRRGSNYVHKKRMDARGGCTVEGLISVQSQLSLLEIIDKYASEEYKAMLEELKKDDE